MLAFSEDTLRHFRAELWKKKRIDVDRINSMSITDFANEFLLEHNKDGTSTNPASKKASQTSHSSWHDTIPQIQPTVLIVTVNEYETKAVISAFEKTTGRVAKDIPIGDRLYRMLGKVNGTTFIHTLTEMGSAGIGATQQTIEKGIQAINPEAVIAVGIAFGVNDKKQSIGDILISRQIYHYEAQRVGRKIVCRGDKSHASPWLVNFFVGFAQAKWNTANAVVRSGVILTGEKLVDNLAFRDQLLTIEPEAIGGEMEGSGVYIACFEHKIDWIVVKAICDWADGQKSKNKSARQKKAANNAADFIIQAVQHAQLKRSPQTKMPPVPSILPSGNALPDNGREMFKEVWAALCDLLDAAELMWQELSQHTMSEFIKARNAAQTMINRKAIYFQDDDWSMLNQVLYTASHYEAGKENLLELRRDNPFILHSDSDMLEAIEHDSKVAYISRQIKLNKRWLNKYRKLLATIRGRFYKNLNTSLNEEG